MREEIVRLTIEVVDEIVRNCQALDKFKTRARQLADDVMYKGLAYTLAVAAARSSGRVIDELLRSREKATDYVKRFCAHGLASKLGIKNEEELSYALYTLALIAPLKETGLVRALSFTELLKHALSDPIMDMYAFRVALWVKRLAEALILGGR